MQVSYKKNSSYENKYINNYGIKFYNLTGYYNIQIRLGKKMLSILINK